MIEIERKFLVTTENFKSESFTKHEIAQGYLNCNHEANVSIRITGESCFIIY